MNICHGLEVTMHECMPSCGEYCPRKLAQYSPHSGMHSYMVTSKPWHIPSIFSCSNYSNYFLLTVIIIMIIYSCFCKVLLYDTQKGPTIVFIHLYIRLVCTLVKKIKQQNKNVLTFQNSLYFGGHIFDIFMQILTNHYPSTFTESYNDVHCFTSMQVYLLRLPTAAFL